MDMQPDHDNEAEWLKPENWKPVFGSWLMIYASRRDRRILVPKRNPQMGFTVNAGQPAGKAILFFLGIVVPLAVAAAILRVATGAK
jgi:uncharacterized membrane protein